MKRGVDIMVAWLGDTRGVCVCVTLMGMCSEVY